MALWRIYENGARNYCVLYVNLATSAAEVLGHVRGETPLHEVVDWIVRQGQPDAGDVIVLPGRVLSLLRSQGVV